MTEKMSPGYRFTDDEKQLLDTVFTYNRYPDQTELQDLADKLAVSELKVVNWFTRQRYQAKKKRTTQARLLSKYYPLYLYMHSTKRDLELSCIHSIFTYEP